MTDDSEEDPFEKLDESVGDREGDPFEQLAGQGDSEDAQKEEVPDAGPPDETGSVSPERATAASVDRDTATADDSDTTQSVDSETATPSETDGFEPIDSERGSGTGSAETAMKFGIDRREPAQPGEGPELSDVESREGNPYESVEKAFAEMEIDQLDADRVWQELTSAESRGSVGNITERGYAEVSKHSYCEQCEHFSEPPAVHCTHEGTEIIEFVDMENVRVVDCPIVAEREELEEGN